MFQISSVIQNLRTLADKSWRIQIDTQELSPEEASALMQLHGKQGWFLFKENPIATEDLPEEPAPEFKDDKTPSQRLRGTLWLYWNTNTDKRQPFNQFYEGWIEKKLEEIKNYL